MFNSSRIQVNLNSVLHTLFCWYALSVSFELILEQLFDIDTILKPFRILSLSIIGVYVIQSVKHGIRFYSSERKDILLYSIFVYGLLISCVQVALTVFNMGLFYNDLFLVGLHVLVFFVFKATPISSEIRLKILHYFVTGVVLNACYILYNVFFKIQFGRQAGFIDNPNYAALGLVAAMAFFLIRSNYYLKFIHRLAIVMILVLLIYIFVITGSRAGLVIFLLVLFFLFLYATFRRKLLIILISGVIVFQLVSLGGGYAYSGVSLVLINRINQKSMNDQEEDVRFAIWDGVFRALEDRGYWGMGIGQFKANFVKYFNEESNPLIVEIVNRRYYLSPHNDYLAILADYGWPSLMFYLIFLFLAVTAGFKKFIVHEKNATLHFLNRYNFVILLCLIVFGLAAENFQHQLFWFLLMVSTKSLTNPNTI